VTQIIIIMMFKIIKDFLKKLS